MIETGGERGSERSVIAARHDDDDDDDDALVWYGLELLGVSWLRYCCQTGQSHARAEKIG